MNLYGDNIYQFLDYMLQADDHLDVDPNIRMQKSIFSPLVNTKYWRAWLRSFCRLIIYLEDFGHGTGKNWRGLDSKKDYYCYRKVCNTIIR